MAGGGETVRTQEKKKKRRLLKAVVIRKAPIVIYGPKAAFSPAACDTIYRHFLDFRTVPSDYDLIVTGDLGSVGQEILIKLLREKGFDIRPVHRDCGVMIYDAEKQDTHSGGSGCGCAASVLCARLLPALEEGKWKRILFVPTGALLSKVSFNEGDTIPGIAHGVVLEHVEKIPGSGA